MGELPRFVEEALGQLTRGLSRACDTTELVETVSENVWTSLAKWQTPTVGNATVIKEAFRHSLAYHLHRTSRYAFAQKTGNRPTEGRVREGGASQLPALDDWPVLASVWEDQVRGWARFLSAFLCHVTTFLNRRSPGLTICEMETDLSDPHHKGRSVIRVTLSDKSQWYYKPRSGRREAAWKCYIAAVNSAGFAPSLSAANVHTCRGHCWMPSVQARRCANAQERDKLAQRVGALLYLAHIFKAVDLHGANIVHCGQYPVLVDCESFFHPETRLPVNREGASSLLRTGMFVGVNRNADWPLTGSVPCGHPSNASCKNRKVERSQEVILGFQAMHDFLQSQKDNRLLKSAQAQLQRLPTRHIYRPTAFYYHILRASLGSRMLRNPNKRHGFLHGQLSDGLCSPRTVRSEVLQLLVGDIPFFSGASARPRQSLTKLQLTRALRELRPC